MFIIYICLIIYKAIFMIKNYNKYKNSSLNNNIVMFTLKTI